MLRYPSNGSSFTSQNPAATNNQRFSANLTSLGLGFKLKLPVKDEFFVHPYILLQPGLTIVYTDRYTNNPTVTPNTVVTSRTSYGTFDGQVALGLDFHLRPALACSCRRASTTSPAPMPAWMG
ncbi:MAG: hypothetical protein WKG07_19595 [Hymenobacter sp.]